MAEFDIYEPLLAPADMQSVVRGLQILQQVRRLMDDDVTVWILGLIGGQPHVRKVSCGHAIAFHTDFLWFESVVPKQSPEDLPRRSHEAGRQFCLHGRFGPLKVQYDRAVSSRRATSCRSPSTS